ncbi:sugar hydrolase, partial [Streptomyces daliensis]|nr:sugar hydrolase [Streptomyces daliensis]
IEDDAEAWKTVAITPMIGVNDVVVEVFKPEDATEVRKFADEKGMGWLSMWSGTRDKACPGGPKDQADPTCSSIEQGDFDFTKAFTG